MPQKTPFQIVLASLAELGVSREEVAAALGLKPASRQFKDFADRGHNAEKQLGKINALHAVVRRLHAAAADRPNPGGLTQLRDPEPFDVSSYPDHVAATIRRLPPRSRHVVVSSGVPIMEGFDAFHQVRRAIIEKATDKNESVEFDMVFADRQLVQSSIADREKDAEYQRLLAFHLSETDEIARIKRLFLEDVKDDEFAAFQARVRIKRIRWSINAPNEKLIMLFSRTGDDSWTLAKAQKDILRLDSGYTAQSIYQPPTRWYRVESYPIAPDAALTLLRQPGDEMRF